MAPTTMIQELHSKIKFEVHCQQLVCMLMLFFPLHKDIKALTLIYLCGREKKFQRQMMSLHVTIQSNNE